MVAGGTNPSSASDRSGRVANGSSRTESAMGLDPSYRSQSGVAGLLRTGGSGGLIGISPGDPDDERIVGELRVLAGREVVHLDDVDFRSRGIELAVRTEPEATHPRPSCSSTRTRGACYAVRSRLRVQGLHRGEHVSPIPL